MKPAPQESKPGWQHYFAIPDRTRERPAIRNQHFVFPAKAGTQ
jgi:hypothetical protein